MRPILALIAIAALLPAQGTLKIVVKWDGEVPKPKALVLPTDFVQRNPDEAAFCNACAKKGKLFDETLVVDPKTRGIRDIAISPQGNQILTGSDDDTACLWNAKTASASPGSKISRETSGFANTVRMEVDSSPLSTQSPMFGIPKHMTSSPH